ENVLIDAPETSEELLTEARTDVRAAWVFDDGLSPPTQAQVEYWRQLCGLLSLAKGRGDGAWPVDLAPSSSAASSSGASARGTSTGPGTGASCPCANERSPRRGRRLPRAPAGSPPAIWSWRPSGASAAGSTRSLDAAPACPSWGWCGHGWGSTARHQHPCCT